MAATKDEIREWVERGVKIGATHVIILCDTWDWDDFPSYVEQGESVRNKVMQYQAANDLRVMEVYNLSMDIEYQLDEYRAWHL